jgi:hypothetical protein
MFARILKRVAETEPIGREVACEISFMDKSFLKRKKAIDFM